jgi:hypothetical protein
MLRRPDPRAALRKPFPANSPVLPDVPLAELVRWFQITQVQRLAWPRFSVAGFQWRRAADRTSRALSQRATSHLGPSFPRCDRCKTIVATRHHIRESNGENLIQHYCSTCASVVPGPWFAVAQSLPRSRVLLRSRRAG